MKLKNLSIIFLFFFFISTPITTFCQVGSIFLSQIDGTPSTPIPPSPPGDLCIQYCNIDSTETRQTQVRDMTGDALHTITSAGIIDSSVEKWKIVEFESCTDTLIFNKVFNTSLALCTINHLNVRHDSDPTGIYLVGGATCSGLDGYILNKLDLNTGNIIWAINDNVNNFTPTVENGVTGTIIEVNARSIAVGNDGIYVGGNYEEQFSLAIFKERSFIKKFSKVDGSFIWQKQILVDQTNGYESVEDLTFNINTVFLQIDTAGNLNALIPRQNYVQSISGDGISTNWNTLTETLSTRLPIRIRSDNSNIYSAYRNPTGNNSIIYKLDRKTGLVLTNTGIIATKSISDMNLDGSNIYFTWYYGVDKMTKGNMTVSVWSTGTTCASYALFINGKVMIQSVMNNNNWRLENRLLSNGTTTCTIQTVSCPGGIPPVGSTTSNYFYGAVDINGIYLGYGQADQNNLDSTNVELNPFP